MHRLSQSRITKIISAVVLVNLLWLNTAAAQTPTPAPTATPAAGGSNQPIVITGADWKAAQTDQNACMGTANTSMKNKIEALTQNEFKTFYVPDLGQSNLSLKDQAIISSGTGESTPAVGAADLTTPAGCYILDGQAADSIGAVSVRPSSAVAFESKLGSLSATQPLSSTDLAAIQIQHQQDQAKVGVLSGLIGGVINTLLTTIATFIAFLSVTMAGIMDVVIDNTLHIHYDTVNIVNTGWTVVRDFANMFFILILIVIGLGTILRIEKLNYRHLLGELVLMAILVNFSKVIAITIIKFSDSVGLIFYNGHIKDILVTFYNIIQPDKISTLVAWNVGIGQGLGKVAFSVVALLSFTVLAAMFMIRLVGLYIFIIFSPMYFVMDILPATKDGAHKFLHKFIHYVFWVPVALFMLRLTILVANTNGSGRQGIVPGTDSAFTFFIITAFLWATILIAEEAGMIGGQTVVNWAEKGTHEAALYMARGKGLAAVGNLAAKSGLIKEHGRIHRGFEAWEKGAQYAEGLGGAVKAGLKKSEHHYAEGVDDKSNRIQERLGMLGDFDKDSIGQVTPKFIHELARKGKLNATRVRNIYEHGTRKQKAALLLAFKDGHFDAANPDNDIIREEIIDKDQAMRGIHYDHRERNWLTYKDDRLDVRQTGTYHGSFATIKKDGTRYDNREAYYVPKPPGGPAPGGPAPGGPAPGGPAPGGPAPGGPAPGGPAPGGPAPGGPAPGGPAPGGPAPGGTTPPPPRPRVIPNGFRGRDVTAQDYNDLHLGYNQNHYDVLGVSQTASPDEIKKAWRDKSKQLHPDAGGDADKFSQANAAYQVLSNPGLRQRFDKLI